MSDSDFYGAAEFFDAEHAAEAAMYLDWLFDRMSKASIYRGLVQMGRGTSESWFTEYWDVALIFGIRRFSDTAGQLSAPVEDVFHDGQFARRPGEPHILQWRGTLWSGTDWSVLCRRIVDDLGAIRAGWLNADAVQPDYYSMALEDAIYATPPRSSEAG